MNPKKDEITDIVCLQSTQSSYFIDIWIKPCGLSLTWTHTIERESQHQQVVL